MFQVRNNVKLWQLFAKLTLTNIENETFEELEKVVSYLHKAFWSAIQDSGFEKDIKDTLGTMQITSQLIDGRSSKFTSVQLNSFCHIDYEFNTGLPLPVQAVWWVTLRLPNLSKYHAPQFL